MNASHRWIVLSFSAAVFTYGMTGCSGKSAAPTAMHADSDHAHEGHQGSGHDHGADGHHDGPLTEKDVKLPDSFTSGVAREQELHEEIKHLIEHGDLTKVHRVAEEMSLVAKKMKELARKELAEDKQVEAGRLCNELASFYPPIDEAADAGKKAETEAIHKQMAETIKKLKALAT